MPAKSKGQFRNALASAGITGCNNKQHCWDKLPQNPNQENAGEFYRCVTQTESGKHKLSEAAAQRIPYDQMIPVIREKCSGITAGTTQAISSTTAAPVISSTAAVAPPKPIHQKKDANLINQCYATAKDEYGLVDGENDHCQTNSIDALHDMYRCLNDDESPPDNYTRQKICDNIAKYKADHDPWGKVLGVRNHPVKITDKFLKKPGAGEKLYGCLNAHNLFVNGANLYMVDDDKFEQIYTCLYDVDKLPDKDRHTLCQKIKQDFGKKSGNVLDDGFIDALFQLPLSICKTKHNIGDSCIGASDKQVTDLYICLFGRDSKLTKQQKCDAIKKAHYDPHHVPGGLFTRESNNTNVPSSFFATGTEKATVEVPLAPQTGNRHPTTTNKCLATCLPLKMSVMVVATTMTKVLKSSLSHRLARHKTTRIVSRLPKICENSGMRAKKTSKDCFLTQKDRIDIDVKQILLTRWTPLINACTGICRIKIGGTAKAATQKYAVKYIKKIMANFLKVFSTSPWTGCINALRALMEYRGINLYMINRLLGTILFFQIYSCNCMNVYMTTRRHLNNLITKNTTNMSTD